MSLTKIKKTHLENKLRLFVGGALREIGIKNVAADVFLLKSGEISRLKSRFYPKCRRKIVAGKISVPGGVVDVLAFPEPKKFPHPESDRRVLGEIYLNEDLANSGYGKIKFMAIHGLLHLLGYSHEKKRDIVNMERMEKKLLLTVKS